MARTIAPLTLHRLDDTGRRDTLQASKFLLQRFDPPLIYIPQIGQCLIFDSQFVGRPAHCAAHDPGRPADDWSE
jgi:hypothetical protein